jgi:hypothetical protein
MRPCFAWMSLSWSLPAIVLLGGCRQSDDSAQNSSPAAPAPADHHDVPITKADVEMPANYADAVVRINEYRDAIQTGAGGENPHLAHRPLDELDIVLRELPAMARDSGVPAEKLEAVNLAARELRSLFNQVHAAIDESRPPNYSAVAEKVDAAIGRLEAVLPTAGD